ncbi:helix-turn-helix transcriptional regulator [Sphingopyxis sp. PAMC25046]|uniref:helix-turn-helix transcriptional regulator n=1 Tax=Sphingopyxis sp. PAMC25046 TaxID=2565556 RepID=UPI00109DDB59|nr:helix-turn-helix transcriptional regulator [Sphingopyxis sp. PAMC25046]QCB55849.1 helix-turn-helix transcriptional regulator [Sphingopyxis sp. PAMC25046]
MEGSQTSTADDRLRWDRLTDKQRACLDLLLERKTSKEIARALGISKFTVDQRLRTARAVLGAAGRDDAALRYARLRKICDRIAYHPVDIPAEATIVPSDFADGVPDAILDIRESAGIAHPSGGPAAPSGKIWRHDHALAARFLIIAALLSTLIIFLAGSIGIAEVLTRLLAG